MAYICDFCGAKVDDAYNITKYFNGAPSVKTVCKECIEKIGKVPNEETEDMEENGSS